MYGEEKGKEKIEKEGKNERTQKKKERNEDNTSRDHNKIKKIAMEKSNSGTKKQRDEERTLIKESKTQKSLKINLQIPVDI